MTLKTELETRCTEIFRSPWTTRAGRVVPAESDVGLGNDGVELDATVLYADIADSTQMVDSLIPALAAEIYKAFLHSAAKIITSNGGTITAYDGDRVMAVFIGDYKNTSAVKAALQINYATKNIVRPAMKAIYTSSNHVINHVVGIDTSKLLVARTGIRGSNDLVWVGRAANHAAKMAALDHSYPTYITAEVYDMLADEAKISNGANMWEACTWNAQGRRIYRSTYWWTLA